MTDSFASSIEPTRFGTSQASVAAPVRDAMLRLDADLSCQYADGTFAAMFAIDAAALNGKPLTATALPKPLVAIFITLAEDVLAKGLPHRARAAWQHDGRQCDVDVLALPERSMQGPTHAVTFCINLAPGSFTAERAARVRVEAAMFARDRMLSIASHDLRGPLNAIHSWGHVLERKLPTGDAALQRALAGIRTGVEQQVKLIESVLDAPRAATRALTLERRPVALRALLDEVLDNLQATFANRRGTLIEADLRLTHQQVEVDRERLWQALWTVLAFAVDASAPGAAVALDASESAGTWSVTIAYRLSPASLADERVAHVFEPFVRAEATQPRRANEVALALSLPRQVIEAHGGEFSAQAPATDGELSFIKVSVPFVAIPA